MDTVTQKESTQKQEEVIGLPRLLSVKQVAKLTGYAPGTIYNMIADGKLPSVKNGDVKQARVTIPEDAYLAWFKSLTVRNPIKTRNYNRRKVA